jgi:transmembrane sensor
MNHTSYDDLEVRRQRALDEAAAWLVRLQDTPPTAAERGAFADWLRESPLHIAAMLRVSQTDQALTAFPNTISPFTDTVVEWRVIADMPQANTRSPPHGTLRFIRAAVAMCVAFVAVAALWWEGVIGGTVYRTSIGERHDVALQDGSTLRLGPQSQVRVQLFRNERDVVLQRGEAVFKVAKDPSRPFVVCANRARVRAVGTEFGVEKRSDSVVVTVAEGRVAVTQDGSALLPFLVAHSDGPAVPLAAGEQVAVLPVGGPGTIRKVDSSNSLAWSNGRLVFDNEPISFAVERFNQYNRIQLVVLDSRLASRRISGSFDATDLDSFLAFLSAAVPVSVVRAREGTEIAIDAPRTRTPNVPSRSR